MITDEVEVKAYFDILKRFITEPDGEYQDAKDKDHWMYMAGRADGERSMLQVIDWFLFPEDKPPMGEGTRILLEASIERFFDVRNKPRVFEDEDMVR